MSLQKANEQKGASLIKSLQKRNMQGFYCATKEEAKQKVLELIKTGSSVAWGGSESIKEIGLLDEIKNSGKFEVIDRSLAKDAEEQRQYLAKTMLSDYFLMSTNALTIDGQLINIDGNGNRVAALCNGPKQVIIVAGLNKLVMNVEDGIKRVRNIASPPNTIRLNKNTPCAHTGFCGDCYGDDCICSQIVITRRSRDPERMKVILVGENLGY